MALDKDPWSGMRSVTNNRDRGGISSSGGFSRDSGMSANRGGVSAGTRVAAVGGWNFGGGGGARPSFDPWSGLRSTNRPVTPAFAGPRTPNVHSRNMALYRNAIAGIESRGWGAQDYQAIGPTHPTLGRALGRYQMMEGNIGPWSKRAIGREVSADEFLSSPDLQNRIFDHKFGGYINKFGDPEKAAQAWFGGPGSVGKLGRKDVLGTSVGKYAKMFSANLKKENRSTENTVQTVAVSPRSAKEATGMPGAMAAIGKGIAAGGASLSASANAQGIGRGGLLSQPEGFEQTGGLAIPPVGFEGGVGAGARGSASVSLPAGIDMGSMTANAGLRAGSGGGVAATGGATMRDMFAGSWAGKTQLDDATLMAVIGGDREFGTSGRESPRRKKVVLKNESYGLL